MQEPAKPRKFWHPLSLGQVLACFLVAQLESQKPATREEFDKGRGEDEAGLVAPKQAEALALYVKRLRDREKAEIKVDDQNVFGNKGDAGAEEQGEEDDEGP